MDKEELVKTISGGDMTPEELREALNAMAIDMGIMFAQMEADNNECVEPDNVASHLYLLKRMAEALK